MAAPYKFTPAQFEKAWKDYFKWCDNNPWYKNEAIKSGERAGEIIRIPTARPYSEVGFCAYHDLGEKYVNELGHTLANKSVLTADEAKLSNILKQARAKCTSQKFEGAAVGVFNANIIARDLGMVDKKEVENSGNIVINVPSAADGLGE